MRKKFLLVLILILSASMFVPILSSAKTDEITVYIDGEAIEFDVKPQIVNERTMVPMRAIFEKLDATVLWDEETETITSTRTIEDDKEKEEREIILQVGSSTMQLNGEIYYKLKDRSVSLDKEVALDSPAFITDERTLVPLRAISEALGLYVGWDGDTNTVIISTLNSGVASVSRENYDMFASIIKENAEKFLVSQQTDYTDGSQYYSYHIDYVDDLAKLFTDDTIASLEYRLYDDRIEINYEREKTKYGYDMESVYFTYYNDLSRSASVVLCKDETSIDAYYIYGIDGYELQKITDESVKETTDVVLYDTIDRVMTNASSESMHFIGGTHTELFR